MLAGFSIAFIGLVAGSATAFRWPGWTLLLLTASALLLITAVQGGFWVRHYRPDIAAEDVKLWPLAMAAYTRAIRNRHGVHFERAGPMRAVLLSRLSSRPDLLSRVTVLPWDALNARLDGPAGTIVMINVLQSLEPDYRRQL